ncbi:MAG: type VI secretion system-associated FHA domain protein [Ramlibacter sp.]
MALELHIAGPGLDVVRMLEEGGPELVLGRDAECGVCLPDPQRNVSRRHLAVWLQDGTLHFRVLSVVNGVEMPFGEAPPGAQGVLPTGQTLKLADYSLNVNADAAPPPSPMPGFAPAAAPGVDPWSVFDRDASGAAPAARPMPPAPVPASSSPSGPSSEDDPFGDWGFETTFGPGAPGAGPLEAGTLEVGDLPSLFRGLGIDPAALGPLSHGELETIGRLMRVMLRGLLELHSAAVGVKEGLRADDRTMLGIQNNNPLKNDWPEETKLRYLFGGRAAGIGFVNPERALRELLAELVAHELATGSAVRAALYGTLKEFDPAALKTRLLGEGTRFLEGNKAWAAYSKYYAEQGTDMPAWTRRLLDRYFAEAYVREALRIKRETGPQQR